MAHSILMHQVTLLPGNCKKYNYITTWKLFKLINILINGLNNEINHIY